MKNSYISKQALSTIFMVLLIGSIVSSISIGYRYMQDEEQQRSNLLDSLENEQKKIDSLLHSFEATGKSLAKSIAKDSCRNIDAKLLSALKGNPSVYKIRIAFAPNTYEHKSYFAKECKRVNDRIAFDTLKFNYTIKTPKFDPLNSDWYGTASENRSAWGQPYKEYTSPEYVVEYTVPAVDNNDRFIASVSVALSATGLRNFMKHLKFKETGYAAIFTDQARTIYHPKLDLVYDTLSLFGLARSKMAISSPEEDLYKNAEKLIDIVEQSIAGKAGCYDYSSIVTFQDMTFCSHPLSNGWSLACLCMKSEVMAFHYAYKWWFYALSVLFTLTASIGMFLLFWSRPWAKSISISSIIGIGIALVWVINYQFPVEKWKKETVIGDYEGLKIFESKHKHKTSGDAIFIPTGVFIQSIEFNSANNFKATGYIWQHYDVADTTSSRGFVLPEAEDLDLEVAYERTENGRETIGWYFTATVRERFDYADFPFDRERLWLRLWHKDFDKNIVLVPDINSYDVMKETFKPGIEMDFVLNGWNIMGSHFSYLYNSYNTNFGLKGYVGQTDFPELYFNICVAREFINPFISHLIPMIVVMLMLFAILQVGRRNDKQGLFGFSSLSAVSACSALFFVIIFNHINIRNTLSVSGLVYFEWFYIICYFAIMYVSISAILIAKDKEIFLLQYNDNFYSRVLFVPAIMALGYIVTMVNFF